jgi:hypothetical protein
VPLPHSLPLSRKLFVSSGFKYSIDGPSTTNHLSRKWSLPLGAHASSPLKKQLISCGPKFLGEEDVFASRFGVTRCTNCG